MPWELDFLNWINNNLHGWEWMTIIIRYITALGDGGFIWFLTAIILICIKKTRPAGLVLLIGVSLIGATNNYVVKLLVNRIRPFNVAGEDSLKTFVTTTFAPLISIGKIKLFGLSKDSSFMSGHTVSSCVSATIIYSFNKKYGIVAIVLAALISLSRLFLCMHYPTDVICGAIWGVSGGLLIMHFYKKIEKRIQAKRTAKQ